MERKNKEDLAGALNEASDLNEVEGHTEFVWTPRSYTVQADTGAVTGAQAGIYSLARAALDQSLRLLDGLYPLLPGEESGDTVTVLAVVRDQFTALVGEFGGPGAPNVARIDGLFDLLVGSVGSLCLLKQVLGLDHRNVVTIDDEQNLTNFRIIIDYVTSLKENWDLRVPEPPG